MNRLYFIITETGWPNKIIDANGNTPFHYHFHLVIRH